MSATGAPWLPRSVQDRTRLIELRWGRVFVVDVGPDDAALPPLLLVHGLFTTSYAFDRLIPRLASTRRVIAIDLPGCGDSDHPDTAEHDRYTPDRLAADLADVLAALDIGDVDVVGHDFGGTVAFALATGRSLVRRMVLSAPLLLHPSVPFEGPLAMSVSLGAEVFATAVRRADLQRVLAQGVSTPELVDETELNIYWDRLGRQGAREATHAMLTQLGSVVGLRERFARLTVPTLLVWGDRDRVALPDQGQRLSELLPGQPPVYVIEGCGHNPARERPEPFARAIEGHCRAEEIVADSPGG